MKKYYFFNFLYLMSVLLVIIFSLSCSNKPNKEAYQSYINKITISLGTNAIIDFDNMQSLNKDYNFNSSNFKLIFTGYMNCSPCVLRLKKIQELIDKELNLSLIHI